MDGPPESSGGGGHLVIVVLFVGAVLILGGDAARGTCESERVSGERSFPPFQMTNDDSSRSNTGPSPDDSGVCSALPGENLIGLEGHEREESSRGMKINGVGEH